MRDIFNRVSFKEGSRDPRKACLKLFLDAYLHTDHSMARRLLFETVADSQTHHLVEAAVVANEIRAVLLEGGHSGKVANALRTRQRAWELLLAICDPAVREWKELVRKYSHVRTDEIPQEAKTQWAGLAQLFDCVSKQFYFASGAHDISAAARGREDAHPLPLSTMQTFWRESQPLLDLLGGVGLVPAVHRIIEFLYAYIELGPKEVFLRIARMVIAGQEGGYSLRNVAVTPFQQVTPREAANGTNLSKTAR